MRRDDVGALVGIALLYLLMESAGITCPIRFLTGISCAGCGMSRAWLSLLRGDLSGAFHYHPLFWAVVPGAALLLFRRLIPERTFRGCLAVLCASFLIVYLVRLLLPGEIVSFQPEQGFLYRSLCLLSGGQR